MKDSSDKHFSLIVFPKRLINYKLILKIFGALLLGEALLMMVPLLVTIFHVDDRNDNADLLGFIFGILITVIVALLCRYYGQPEKESMMRKESFLVVTFTWIIFSVFGSLPFLMSGLLPNFTDAYFETMSGFTTTGATVVNDIERYPSGLMLWRSMTQWIGGLGITFFTIAILPGFAAGGSMKVFSAEATGPLRTKMHPKLSTNAKLIISVYLVLTVLCCLMFWAEGMTLFDAINYSMSTTATGGFSTHNSSFMGYNTASIDFTMTLFMFLSGANFTLLYLSTIKRQPYKLFKDSEFRFYTTTIAVATVFVALYITFTGPQYNLFTALRKSLFHVVAFMTTTGTFSDNVYDTWPRIAWMVLILLTFIGGCAGSTSGGMKSIRAVMLIKIVKNELRKLLHPKAVLPLKINGQNIDVSRQTSLLAFLVVYVMLIFATFCVLMIFDGDWLTTRNAFSISISSATNVGPSLSEAPSWMPLSAASKWFCSFLMLMGRLEILSVLILFSKSFWRER